MAARKYIDFMIEESWCIISSSFIDNMRVNTNLKCSGYVIGLMKQKTSLFVIFVL